VLQDDRGADQDLRDTEVRLRNFYAPREARK
jgi:hypothetical protein